MKNDDTRSKILRTIIDAKKPLSLSDIARRMRTTAQKVDYHLDFLCDSGIVIRDGYKFFCQPILIDPDLREFCAEKVAEIIEAFSVQDNRIVVVNGQEPEDVILNTLHVLIEIVLP